MINFFIISATKILLNRSF